MIWVVVTMVMVVVMMMIVVVVVVVVVVEGKQPTPVSIVFPPPGSYLQSVSFSSGKYVKGGKEGKKKCKKYIK